MKKTLVLFSIICCLTINAQNKSDIEKDTYKLVEMTVKPTFSNIVGQMANYVKTANIQAFTKEIEATYPELFKEITKIYMDEFTYDEIKELLEFYNTDLGKKVIKKLPIIQKKSMSIGNNWGIKIQSILSKYK